MAQSLSDTCNGAVLTKANNLLRHRQVAGDGKRDNNHDRACALLNGLGLGITGYWRAEISSKAPGSARDKNNSERPAFCLVEDKVRRSMPSG
jgi:hypothetical protein